MKEDEGIKIDWEFETETDYPKLLGKPVILQYDYGLTEKEISILDFLPASDLSPADLKFEELTSLSIQGLEQQEVKVKVEDTEPCAAALAIEANIPTPGISALSKWRTFISAAYYHPNILAHEDVGDLKELLHLLGSDINFESVNVMIDLGKTLKDYKPAPLRPMLPFSQKPPIFNFAHVTDFSIDMEFKVCIVTKYGINDSMKKAVTEMVVFIEEYPEALYLEIYGFILDFLLKFGVQSEIIIDAVMRTQTRRRKSQRPASVLILKKANRMGKGRKEFLQQKLLETPERKYHPVVPIISEPTPVRHLRNRRTGPANADSTPDGRVEAPHASSISHSQPLPVTEIGNCNNASSNSTLVFAVKRKLFPDECEEDLKLKKEVVHDLPSNISSKDWHSVTKHVLGSRKKRFYSRRDSSTIEKPFTCSICPDRSFAYKGNLVLHMKKKHTSASSGKARPKRQENQVPPFSFPVCLQGFASKYRCKTHMERFHPDHADWDPISNVDALPKLKKTVTTKRKCNGNKVSKGIVPKSTRQKLVPLSETQNSSPENENTSQFCPKPSYYSNRFASQKQQLNIHISKQVPVKFNELPYSTLSHVRTRQQFRAAVK